MVRMGTTPALALVFPLLLSGSTPAGTQTPQEKKIVIESKTTRQGWLGVQIQDMSAEQAKELNVAAKEGALVTDVTPGSPAEKGGIKKDDVVVDFNGRVIYDGDDLMKAVRRARPGTTASVVVERKEGKKSLQVTVGKLKQRAWGFGPGAIPPPAAGRLRFFHASTICGMQLADLNPQLGEYFGAPEGEGVLVEEVNKESEGAKAGFKAGDVILRIREEKIEDIGDVTDALEGFKEGEKADVEILRKGSRQTLSLTIEEEEISGAHPLPPDAEGALKENLGQMRKNLEHLREQYGPEFREQLREELEKIRVELGPEFQKQLRESVGKLREEFGPEFQKQMRELKRELREIGNRSRLERDRLRAQHLLPPDSI